MDKRYYITTAIDYANGAPHIGHAYEKVLTDVIARYQKLKGQDVYFLTGVDQYGQKVQQSAEKEGVHPATFARKNTKKFLKLWERLGVNYDGWAETTHDAHKACVQSVLSALYEKGQLYKKAYKGHYSVRQEQFLTEKERGADGSFGPEWGEVLEIEEENWYFKLSEHVDWLRTTIEEDALQIIPQYRKAEVLNAVERSIGTDLCISRPKERLRWGIELPFAPDYVTYVWFDALLNYLSFAGYQKEGESELPEFSSLWPADLQVIGKDILIPPHAIYWPCMLHAMGFDRSEMPTLLVHGFWTNEGEKMSKSLGNIVDPHDPCEEFGEEAFRYFLARNIITGKDSDYSKARLIAVYNDELANNLGNLLNRSLTMTRKAYEGKVPSVSCDDALSEVLRGKAAATLQTYKEAIEKYELSGALEAVNALVTATNKYAEEQKPWELTKKEEARESLATVLYHMLEVCAQVGVLLQPFIPLSGNKILTQLGVEDSSWSLSTLQWGLLQAGGTLAKPKPVFPRIQISKE